VVLGGRVCRKQHKGALRTIPSRLCGDAGARYDKCDQEVRRTRRLLEPAALVLAACLCARALQPRREELDEHDPFDEGVFCRSRFWLFLSYVVSFASIIGSVAVLPTPHTIPNLLSCRARHTCRSLYVEKARLQPRCPAAQVLLSQYALKPGIDNPWPGVAGLFQVRPARFCRHALGPCALLSRAAQVTLILASALLFFVSRTPSSDSNYGGYGAF
jgi:hypothetical protein